MQERKRRKKFNGRILKGAFHLSELSDRLGHFRRNENFNFNQNYPARSIKSWIACTKEIVFQQKRLEKAHFIVKMTGPAIVRPANSDFWKAPLVFIMAILEIVFGRKNYLTEEVCLAVR